MAKREPSLPDKNIPTPPGRRPFGERGRRFPKRLNNAEQHQDAGHSVVYNVAAYGVSHAWCSTCNTKTPIAPPEVFEERDED